MTRFADAPSVVPTPMLLDDLEPHRSHLFGLAYRITGDPQTAEDVVQDTFVKALSSPPKDQQRAIRPWLTRVAANESRDRLRRRKASPYFGTWLPGPVETDERSPGTPHPLLAFDFETPEARYTARESASFAFLIAVETLNENQRATLILRDVYDLSVSETAAALGLTEANVKVLVHRARAALSEYDESRVEATPERRELAAELLNRLLACIGQGDIEGIRALLAEDAMGQGDGGGITAAAVRPHRGIDRVARGMASAKVPPVFPLTFELRSINGEPAFVMEFAEALNDNAKRLVYHIEINASGKIQRANIFANPNKLGSVRWSGPMSA